MKYSYSSEENPLTMWNGERNMYTSQIQRCTQDFIKKDCESNKSRSSRDIVIIDIQNQWNDWHLDYKSYAGFKLEYHPFSKKL